MTPFAHLGYASGCTPTGSREKSNIYRHNNNAGHGLLKWPYAVMCEADRKILDSLHFTCTDNICTAYVKYNVYLIHGKMLTRNSLNSWQCNGG